jgi:hypothetical protein
VTEPPEPPAWAQPVPSTAPELLADSLGVTADTLRAELRGLIAAAQLTAAPTPGSRVASKNPSAVSTPRH